MSRTDTDDIIEIARDLKVERVKDHPTEPDLPVFAMAVRGDDIVAHVFAGPGPYGGRLAAYWAAAFFEADEVVMVADSRMLVSPKEGPGLELQAGELGERWYAGERDGIEEVLSIYRIPAEGETSMLLYPYEVVGDIVVWKPQPDGHGAKSLGGAIPDNAAEGFAQAKANAPLMAAMSRATKSESDLSADELYRSEYRARGRFVSEQDGIGGVAVLKDDVILGVFIGGVED